MYFNVSNQSNFALSSFLSILSLILSKKAQRARGRGPPRPLSLHYHELWYHVTKMLKYVDLMFKKCLVLITIITIIVYIFCYKYNNSLYFNYFLWWFDNDWQFDYLQHNFILKTFLEVLPVQLGRRQRYLGRRDPTPGGTPTPKYLGFSGHKTPNFRRRRRRKY